jgi:ubiquinol-cytochrome c reductase cytochrome c subunit
VRRALVTGLLALALAGGAAGATGPPPYGIVSSSSGAGLYAANCASCHGPRGEGIQPPGRPGAGNIKGAGPSLMDAGELGADFYLSTGYMPLRNPHAQPARSQVLFSQRELERLVRFVGSLGQGPPIPTPHPERGNLAEGLRLFTEHCAGCHQVVAEGGYVTKARVPPLEAATDRQIAEAVRIGPYVMPRFSTRAISDRQLDSLIRYVDYTKHPDDAGGWAIGHLGPVPEGIVTWLIAAAALVAACVVLGRRLGR